MTVREGFDPKVETENIVQYIRGYFAANACECAPAVIGISGGKDSAVVAALCVEALGKDRVIGVMMPYGKQSDIHDSKKVVDTLGIRSEYVDISCGADALKEAIHAGERGFGNDFGKVADASFSSMKARMRMVTLYGISQTVGGRVANTCNLSEGFVGYETRYGDAAGDFYPLSEYLASEVIAIGRYLGVVDCVLDKAPSDGLCGKTDEDAFGFTYNQLDAYISNGTCGDEEADERIAAMHAASEWKRVPQTKAIPTFA